MKQFAALIQVLDETNKTNAKVAALVAYFKSVSANDALNALALFLGKRPKRPVNAGLLRAFASEAAEIAPWLFEESYHIVGDLAETIALSLPEPIESIDISLTELIDEIQGLSKKTDEEKKLALFHFWNRFSFQERFVFNKLITGGWRIGVSEKLITRALAQVYEIDINVATHRLMGNWLPSNTTLQALLFEEDDEQMDIRPYPFHLAYPLEQDLKEIGLPQEWIAEWKWDGIRGQLIHRNTLSIWSRGEDLITEKFPELVEIAQKLPKGTVLDGEIIAFLNGEIQPFHLLQTRLGRKNITEKIKKEAPAAFIAYDILEYKGEDIRQHTLQNRKELLSALLNSIERPEHLLLSEGVAFSNWEELTEMRLNSRAVLAEGFMLKHKESVYQTGRKKGAWWKWKVEPLSIDAVLIYAQRGHGRRANLYTDYTFAVWDENGTLVPFTKAYSGLTDKELFEVDNFVKRNTKEKFGPVRSVKPELVMEIGFEGINPSPRHKSGIALRFPRILRWRKDKPMEEANTLSDLKNLLYQFGSSQVIDE